MGCHFIKNKTAKKKTLPALGGMLTPALGRAIISITEKGR